MEPAGPDSSRGDANLGTDSPTSLDAASDDAPVDAGPVPDAGAPPADAGSAADGAPATCGVPTSFKWTSSGPLTGPMSDATHDLVAIKDPTVVFFDGKWQIYATTANSSGSYNMEYLSFTDWSAAGSAAQYYMDRKIGRASCRERVCLAV